MPSAQVTLYIWYEDNDLLLGGGMIDYEVFYGILFEIWSHFNPLKQYLHVERLVILYD